MQFGDAETALHLTGLTAIASFNGGATAFRNAVRDVGSSLPGIDISDALTVSETRTAVRAFIEFYDERGAVSSRSPRTFLMSRSGGGWRLGDASYLEDQAQAVSKARKGSNG